MKTILSTVVALGLTAMAGAGSGNATFTVIGPGTAVDVTPDGQFVLISNPAGASIWTKTDGVVGLGGKSGVGISDDGTTVLGQILDGTMNVAGRWTQSTGWVSLGPLPGSAGCGADLSNPYGLSGDGAVAVGLGWDGCSGRAFKWTPADGMVALTQLGPNSARANGVSGDGSAIGGWDEHSTGPRLAAIWYADGTEILVLEGHPNNPEGLGETWGFSTDGTIAVGQAHKDIATGGAFRFMDGAVDIISPLPGTDPFQFTTAAFCVSDDGSLVAGTNISGFGPFAAQNAIIWTEDGGTQLFQDMIVAAGATLPDGMVLASVQAMTPDGRTFAGYARSGFATTAFVATLPAPCDSDLDGDGATGFDDLLLVLSAWGPCAGCPEDIDGDGEVGFSDLLVTLSSWGPCR
jgi:uncharacterized membrane protein